jgi:hypothetical protein
VVTKPSRSKIKHIYRKNEAHHKVFCPASRYFPRVSRAARGSGRRSATTLAAAAEAGRISNAVRTDFFHFCIQEDQNCVPLLGLRFQLGPESWWRCKEKRWNSVSGLQLEL